MNWSRLLQGSAVALVLLAGSATRAQDQQPPADSQPSGPVQPLPPDESNGTSGNGNGTTRTPPAPAGRGIFVGGSSAQESGQVTPDSGLLSGAETLGVGMVNTEANIFDISLLAEEGISTGIVLHHNDWLNSFGGTLTLRRSSTVHRLVLLYSGAGNVYFPDSSFNSSYHRLDFSETVLLRRWTFRIADDFQLSPESSFGGLSVGALNLLTALPTSTNVVPDLAAGNETILTGAVTQVNNIALGEIDYSLTRNTALSVSGSYGVLHLFNSGFIDSNYVTGQAGYNYMLSAKNSIALTYTFNRLTFSGTNAQTDTDAVQLNFGRKITGRLAFQAAAGPQYIMVTNFGPSSGNSLTWSAFTTLAYQLPRTQYSFSFSRGVTAGSGVFFGAQSDTVAGSVQRRFTRKWTGLFSAGYAKTSNLVSVSGTNEFNGAFGGVSVARDLGRHFHVGLNYAIQEQSTGPCPAISCGVTPTRQLAGVTLSWHLQPNGLE